jgi:hypothetical protein
MILSFYAHARKGDIEIIITQENIFVNNETEKSENKRKERENSEKSRSFFHKMLAENQTPSGAFFIVSVPDGCALVPGPISAAKVNRGGFPIKNVSRRGDHILFGKGYYLCHGRCVRFLHTMKSSFFLF